MAALRGNAADRAVSVKYWLRDEMHMMKWDEHYQLWSEAREESRQAAQQRMQAARNCTAEITQDDRNWFTDALADSERKWFVAGLFESQSVPKWLFAPMFRAGVLERNPSLNRAFVEPCLRSRGRRQVLQALLEFLESGTDEEKAGAASALYWASTNPDHEATDDLVERLRCRMLREFVDNRDLNVRRRIIPLLNLEPKKYPEEMRSLIPLAIEIARSHPDDYIRHRIEVQLGQGDGLFMPIPDTGAG